MRAVRKKHSAFWRYTAFQVPGWLLASASAYWLYNTIDVPPWVAACLPLAWVIKDYALYPFLRFAYEADQRRPIERLIGVEGAAVEPLAPDGYVRVRGELWRARRIPPDDAVSTGDAVEVVGVEGAMLLVSPAGRARSRYPE